VGKQDKGAEEGCSGYIKGLEEVGDDCLQYYGSSGEFSFSFFFFFFSS